VGVVGGLHGSLHLLPRGLQRVAHRLFEMLHGGFADGDLEKGAHQIADRAFAEMEETAERGDHGRHHRPIPSSWHRRREGRFGPLSAVRAGGGVELVFDDFGDYRRDVGHLMALRLGGAVCSGERVPAMATGVWTAGNGRSLQLVFGHQRPVGISMAGLTASAAPRTRLGLRFGRRGRIRRRRLGRVPGGFADLLTQALKFFPDGVDHAPHRRREIRPLLVRQAKGGGPYRHLCLEFNRHHDKDSLAEQRKRICRASEQG